MLPVVPSFEGFFGGASDVLYYHPEVTREVGKCVKKEERSKDVK